VTGTPGYDASGSMKADLQNQYLYDAEGRVCAVQTPSAPSLPSQMFQYLYDAEGKRIGKGTITQWSCDSDNNGFSLTSEYVLDQGGEQVPELDGSPNGGNWIHTNAYAGGKLIATFDNLGVHYQLADWLGTRRAQVSPAGAIEETCQSLPFGDQLNCVQTNLATANDATEHHFTGKERDAESGLDYFGARYYASNMGRWMSPDWAGKPEAVPYSSLDDPQSLNLYGYVGNNPLSKADKDGHCWPVCTALLGAGLGAVAEGLSELANGEKLNGYKIGAAAAGGALAGAITGPVGDAVEVGLVGKALVQVGASILGGALETKLKGGTVLSKDGAKGALVDGVAGAVGGKVEQAAGKLASTAAAKAIIPVVVNTATDTARRSVTPDPPKPAPPPPPPPKQP
jgi:RHS repeat-associated protein